MRMRDLVRYGLPEALVEAWAEREGPALLPLQELAVRQHDLFGGGNLLVQAPTSSGKTFVGELAAVHTALQRGKVVYLVPLKALAEEKFAEFEDKYAPYGLRVIISTRDRREHDEALENGHFAIAVVVYEKLSQLLVRRPERLREIELVIADELELLSDPDRGAWVEVLLTHLVRQGRRLIALSAVIGRPEPLSAWLDAPLLRYERRPVELRFGVLHEGEFRYRTYNGQTEHVEQLGRAGGGSPREMLVEQVAALAAQGESVLVFVKDRRESRYAARLLAERMDRPPAAAAVSALEDLEATHSREALLETLAHGVAFHNADLAPPERRIIESAFRQGDVRVLVATSTLAVGMNLPAQNVFIAADKWQYDSRFGMPWKAPILRAEYENMGGRAGRLGGSAPFGRSILFAATPFDQEALWRRYVDGVCEPIETRLDKVPLEDPILRLVASRACVSVGELRAFFDATLTGRGYWHDYLTDDEIDCRIAAALGRLRDMALVAQEAGGGLAATPIGQAAAAKGLSLATVMEWFDWLRALGPHSAVDLDLLLTAALTPDGRMAQLSLTMREYEHGGYPDELRRLAREAPLEVPVPLSRVSQSTGPPQFEEVRAIKAALLLDGWVQGTPVYDLEARYQVFAGQILTLADQIGWILDAAAALAKAHGAPAALTEAMAALSERVQHGAGGPALSLLGLRLPGLSRAVAHELVEAGFGDAAAVAAAPEAVLGRWLPARSVHALQRWAKASAAPPDPGPQPVPPALIIDDRQPGQLVLDGVAVRVQDKQFRLARLLAQHAGECVPYDRIYAELWGDTVVEESQMHFQKRMLLKAIRKAVPTRGDCVRTVPKRGFRLDLADGAVEFRTAVSTAA